MAVLWFPWRKVIVPVEFVAGANDPGDTTWNPIASTIYSKNFTGIASVGDTVLVCIVRDATFVPAADIADPPGWTLIGDHQFFPKYIQLWSIVMDAPSLAATHTWTAVQDADNSKAYAVFRKVGSISSMAQAHPATTNPPIVVPSDGCIAYTMVFETLNNPAPSAGTATLIGYSPTIQFEANLGTYYKPVGPADTDGGVGPAGGFRYTVVIEPA